MRTMSVCCLACVSCLLTLVGCGGTSPGSVPLTPAQAVAADKAALAIGYAPGDTSSSVTQNLTLPTAGADGSTISWASSNSGVVTTAGVVSQPLTSDASVTLTATITVGTTSDIKTFPLTVKAQMTDAQAVAAAKAALVIGYASGDSASSVTQNLALPATGLDGSAISWVSSNSAVVTTAGVVNQPLTSDTSVTLTATITVGAASDTKVFQLTVKAQMTDAQAVAAAKAALAIGYASGDAATSVTQNLTLTATGLDGCTVSWLSSDLAISADGTISRPVTGDLPVTLTATITHGAATDTKNFIVIVKAQMTDAQAVAAAKAALLTGYAEGDLPATVTQSLTLPLTGSSGCTVSWASSDPAVVSPDGTVTRPLYGDAQVTLTATIASHQASDTAIFAVTVKGQMSDADAVAAAKSALNIIYASGDSAASVTQNVTLPSSSADGCSVSWASDTPAVVAASGAVTQPLSNDAIVQLTATISSHAVTDTKVFSLTVKAVMNDASAVAADKAALMIVYGPGDSASSVRHNIILPTSGTNGSNITWSSSHPGVITSSGGVTVPADEDALVTMTATISKGSASDTATFDLTVKALLLSSWVNVTAISPGNGAIEVDPGIVIRIPFQQPLDESTVNTTTFQLLKTSNLQNVDISVAYDQDSHIVSLTPLSPLEQGTQYTTVVAGTLKDEDETSLPSPMGFNFTTLSYEDILSQWKFNGDGSDSSGNGNVFTAVNEVGIPSDLYVTDVVHEGSGSLYLRGFWQYGTSNINLGSQLTVAVWVNVDNPIQPNINTILSNTGTGEESNGFKLGINCWNSSDRSVMIEVGDGATGGKWTTAPGLIQPGNWYHLAFVIDQPNHLIKIFYNGAQAPLSFKSDQQYTLDEFNYSFNTAGPFTIGAFPGGMDFNFKGHLDDMRVYNRVLSDEEIAKIAQEK